MDGLKSLQQNVSKEAECVFEIACFACAQREPYGDWARARDDYGPTADSNQR